MRKTSSSQMGGMVRGLASFTLVELLTVMAIIAILAALTLAAGSALFQKGMRSRASGEVQAMSTALEGYKTDNGIYPPSDGVLQTNNYPDQTPGLTTYTANATTLYTNLAGVNFYGQAGLNVDSNGNPVKPYMSFKANQVGNPAGPLSYARDPWNNAYGYSTGDNKSPEVSTPYNGSGFFDLWSTEGLTGTKVVNTNAWISNWQ